MRVWPMFSIVVITKTTLALSVYATAKNAENIGPKSFVVGYVRKHGYAGSTAKI
jgi:hypothetical protein